MNKRNIFIASAWILFVMRLGFSGIMMWAFADAQTDGLRYILLGLSAVFFATAVTQILKVYDFLKKLDTLDLTID